MLTMIVGAITLLGLVFGSFVNALVWRIREQEKSPKNKRLSISKGRSMCPHCKHELKGQDLVPILSWLSLGGKCRYCSKAISVQYPLVEALTALLFVISYLYWPNELAGLEIVIFGLWLAVLTGLIALFIYDLKWYLLPNRIIYPLSVVAGLMALMKIAQSGDPSKAFVDVILAVVVGGGIFYVLFQVSKGKWIGGGDVKLGWLLGLVVGTPALSLLFIFLASIIGSLASLPLLASKRLKKNSLIPFGPFLIFGAFIAQLFGVAILEWYQETFINF